MKKLGIVLVALLALFALACASTPAAAAGSADGAAPAIKPYMFENNQYGPNNQALLKTIFAEPIKAGTTYEFHLAGTADKDIPTVTATLANGDVSVNYWKSLAETIVLGEIKANEPFDFTFELTATADGGGLGMEKGNMLVLEGYADYADGDTKTQTKAVPGGFIMITPTALSVTAK
jgi:hypothetical protein